MPPTLTFDVFVSYAAADRAWVEGFLLDALETAGVRLHTEDAFALGVPRLVEFERAIQQSTRTLLVLSPAYLADSFGQFVDVLVNSYGMETATWPVIPLILQPAALPARLRQLVPLDATTPAAQQAALAKLCATLQLPVPGPAPLPGCPYPGMVPFDEADSARFFGREQEIEDLIERLRLYSFQAVIGASGSGKSSLVRAGLIPALRKSRLFGSGEWVVRTMRPGEQPLATLANIFGLSVTPVPQATIPLPQDGDLLSALLFATNGTEGSIANGDGDHQEDSHARLIAEPALAVEALLATQPGARRLLLVVDQFEELFTVAAVDVEAFQQALLRLSAVAGCAVVLTVRADFYADLMTSLLWPQIQAHRVEVTPLTDEGLRRAIVQPAEHVGVAIEGALVERLVADAAGEPGVLPLIQETLVLLWERLERRFLPMRAYEALVLTRGAYDGQNGGGSGLQVAIARRADATLASLTEAEQAIARRIFLRLIQFGQGRADTRRQQPLDALRSTGDAPALFDSTIQQLAASRLLTLSGAETNDERRWTMDDNPPSSIVHRPSSANVDISHEALIRGWPALQGWLNERREGEQTRRRLEDKAAEWVRLGGGDGGLLDEIELAEAERWLQSTDADEMGFDQALPELVVWSCAAIEQAAQAQEQARQRELAQAQALAEEQQRRAEEQAVAGKRLRQRAVFLTGALVVALIAMVGAGVLWIMAQSSERRAQVQSRQARAGELAAQSKAVLDQNSPLSLLLAVESLTTTRSFGESPVPAADQALHDGLAQPSGQLLSGHVNLIWAVAYSPDGKHVATGSGDRTARVWDMSAPDPTAHPLVLRGHTGTIRSVVYSPDGKYLVTVGDNTARVWDLSKPDPTADPLILSNQGRTVAYSPDGKHLVTVSSDAVVSVWDLSKPDPIADPLMLRSPNHGIFDVAYSLDGRHLAADGDDNTAIVWDLSAADPAAHPLILRDHTGLTSAVAFSPDSRYVAAADSDNTAIVWDLSAPDPAAHPLILHGHKDRITAVAFNPDGKYLVTASDDTTARVWDLSAPDPASDPLLLRGHTEGITTVAFSPYGQYVATASQDQTARVWDLNAPDPTVPLLILRGHDAALFAMTYSPDGQHLVTAGNDGTARVWDVSGRHPSADPLTLSKYNWKVTALALEHTRGRLIAAGDDHSVRVWDLNAPAPTTHLIAAYAFQQAVQLIALSPDGQRAAIVGDTNTAQVWDLRVPDPAAHAVVLPIHDTPVRIARFAPDSRHLVVASGERSVQVWDLNAPDPAARPLTLPSQIAHVTMAVFSPDSQHLITANGDTPADSTAQVWDLSALDPAAQSLALSFQSPGVQRAAFSPDGRYLVTANDAHIVQVWDLSTTDPTAHPLVLDSHEPFNGMVGAPLAFSPDGKHLATAGINTARIWDLDAPDPAADPLILKGDSAGAFTVITAMAFSPDGRHLVTTDSDKTVRVWDMTVSDPSATPLVLHSQIFPADLGSSSIAADLGFSVDGNRLIFAGVADDALMTQVWSLAQQDLLNRACRTAGRNLNWDEWQRFFGRAPYHLTCAELPYHPSYLSHLLENAGDLAHKGEILKAITAYSDTQRLDPRYVVDASHWNRLCRYGTLWGYVKDVQDACGRAVALEPENGDYRDSRGISRALVGDSTGAIEDFEAFIVWARQQDAEKNKDAIDQRETWIATLKSGGKPFNAATLKQLQEAQP